MKRNARIAIISCSSMIILCCFQIQDKKSITDIKTEGFLNSNCFQVIIEQSPDKNRRGLVNKRENASLKVKSNINEIILNRLFKYCINHNIKKNKIINANKNLNYPGLKKSISDKFKSYLSYGFIAEKYYKEDNSIVVIYRIFKNDLKNEIESIEINLK